MSGESRRKRCTTCGMWMKRVNKGWICVNPLCPDEGEYDELL